MNKIFILLLCVLFVSILLWPTDAEPPQEERSDWGGDLYWKAHCINSLKLLTLNNTDTGEIQRQWFGGCEV